MQRPVQLSEQLWHHRAHNQPPISPILPVDALFRYVSQNLGNAMNFMYVDAGEICRRGEVIGDDNVRQTTGTGSFGARNCFCLGDRKLKVDDRLLVASSADALLARGA